MEVGGLIAEAGKVILGIPDVMAALVAWSIFLTFTFSAIEFYKHVKGE